jgi:hypothetical protein
VVDRAARTKAATLFAAWRAGEITNEQVEDCIPCTHDPAVRAAFQCAGGAYTDIRRYLAVGADRMHPAAQQEMRRWELFLDSALPYRWPARPDEAFVAYDMVITPLLWAFCGFWFGVVLADTSVPTLLAPIGGLAVAAMFAVIGAVIALRARSRATTKWSRWLATGDACLYPFCGAEELRACGGIPDEFRSGFDCPRCRYDLSGAGQPGCPECGLGREATSSSPPAAPARR